MTTLWEKIQAEIAALEQIIGDDARILAAKIRDLFEHHASVDMGKTADVVLAAPPAEPVIVQPTIKVEPPAPAVDATPVDIAPAPVAPVVVEAVPVPPAA